MKLITELTGTHDGTLLLKYGMTDTFQREVQVSSF